MKRKVTSSPGINRYQKGAITMFSAVLILILLTSMTLYAVQVGVFEQRKSANENWQKLSFHAADSGIQTAKNFLTINAKPAVNEWLPADAGGTDPHWAKCSDAGLAGKTSGTHPCFGEPVAGLRNGTYYYSYATDSYPAIGNVCPPGNANELPNCWSQFRTDGAGNVNLQETVTVHALLCMLEIDLTKDPVVQGCTTDLTLQNSKYFIITLLARGEADCQVDGSNCGAETLIAEKIGSFSPGGDDGGVGAPLTARTNVPLSGTVEIVPNPNGGGVGVPISSWINANGTDHPECPRAVGADDPISPISGSYATCERHEWYGQDIMPADFKCPTTNCSCDPTKEQMITYASGNDREMGIDIVPDDDFPCDLFEETYGMDWESLKIFTQKHGEILDSCDSLDGDSEGLYWISGPTCALKDQIGGNIDATTGKRNTVMLISAAADTRVSAGAEFFGVLMVTDKEVGEGNADFTGNGHATIYGAAIMDAGMEHFNGTFQIVYVEELIDGAFDIPLTGQVAGGWTDFHAAWR